MWESDLWGRKLPASTTSGIFCVFHDSSTFTCVDFHAFHVRWLCNLRLLTSLPVGLTGEFFPPTEIFIYLKLQSVMSQGPICEEFYCYWFSTELCNCTLYVGNNDSKSLLIIEILLKHHSFTGDCTEASRVPLVALRQHLKWCNRNISFYCNSIILYL